MNFIREKSPGYKLLVTLMLVIASIIVFSLLSLAVAIPFFGMEEVFKASSGGITAATNINLLKLLQVFQSIGLFIVPAFIAAKLFGNNVTHYLSAHNSPEKITIILSVIIVFALNPIINLLGVWNASMELPDYLSGIENWMRNSEDNAEILTKMFLRTETIPGLLFNIFMIAIIPAIGEELLFRGVVQRLFTELTKNKHAAIWISAILFSALHLQFYGFLPRLLLGALFGYLFIWSKSLWLPIIAHFINNAAAVIAYFLYGEGIININPDEIGTHGNYKLAAFASAAVVVFLLYQVYKINKHKKPLPFTQNKSS